MGSWNHLNQLDSRFVYHISTQKHYNIGDILQDILNAFYHDIFSSIMF